MTPRVAGGLLCAVALTLVGCATESGVRAVEYRDARPRATTTTEPGAGGSDADTRPDRILAVDPDTRIVTLDNGLTVYLRENDRPGGSVEMRLVVNAGSAMEAPDQSGVAHFLEHMLFNGTEQFPGNDLIDVLRSFGMEFGADVNAYTS
ncbi:MAG: insulinase family protein, partial [Ilumatobacter sp.]|nr:insulinase family protein [Ilumatobacter sp.]